MSFHETIRMFEAGAFSRPLIVENLKRLKIGEIHRNLSPDNSEKPSAPNRRQIGTTKRSGEIHELESSQFRRTLQKIPFVNLVPLDEQADRISFL